MGWEFLDIKSLPDPGEIVWCRWPRYEEPGTPGPVARPTLVRHAFVHEEDGTGIRYGSVIVSYSTGEYGPEHVGRDLIIEPMDRARAIGLHKPTRFALDRRSSKNLLWCRDFFVPPDYVINAGLVLGKLGADEIEQMRQCLIKRGIIAA